MTDKSSEDRLSAWFDNELSIEERAELEQQLQDSPELRETLDEFGQVSKLLKELPQAKAPEELRPAIMRAIERETLLPSNDETARSRLARQRVTIVVAAVAVLAAVAVWQWGTRSGDQIADNDTTGGDQSVGTIEHQAPDAMANRPEFRDREKNQGSENRWINGGSRGLRIHRDDLNNARVGDIVHAFEADGDVVSVVRMTVVDVESSVEALQVLLTREQIPTDENGEPVEGEDGLLAVFVESRPEHLTRALEQLAKSVEFDSLEVSQSVSIADLEPDVRTKLGLSDAESQPGQRTVMLKPGTQLDKAVRSPGNDAGESATTNPPRRSGKPLRVIFVVTTETAGSPG